MPAKTPEFDVRGYVQTSADLTNEVIGWLRQVKSADYRLLDFGHMDLDADVALSPETLTGILGRPSMGKSMLCKYLAKRELSRIRESGDERSHVFYVTLEEASKVVGIALDGWDLSIQDIVRGRFDLDPTERQAERLLDLPLFCIRHPGVVNGKLPPPLTTSRIYDAIRATVEDYPVDPKAPRIKPSLIVLDYIQILQADKLAMSERNKVAQVTAAIEGAKLLATDLRVPVVMAVQAGRKADDRAGQMPSMADAQWASAIEQACDVVLGVHRPIRHPQYADQIHSATTLRTNINGVNYEVDDRLMVLGLVKQRAGKGAGRYPVRIDPVTLQMEDARPTITHSPKDEIGWPA